MVDRSDSIMIDKPVEEVFAYVADVTNDPAWHTDVVEARKTTDGPVGMGTVWHARFKPAMGISEADMEVVSFEPNRVLAMKGDVGPMHPTLTYRFERADGGTKFTRRVQITVSGWMKIMQPVMGMMAPKQNRGFLTNLKRVLEQRQRSSCSGRSTSAMKHGMDVLGWGRRTSRSQARAAERTISFLFTDLAA